MKIADIIINLVSFVNFFQSRVHQKVKIWQSIKSLYESKNRAVSLNGGD